ncbi:MAG: hypothetical protein QM723_24800 [Myxococcaceae bacterium]
MRLVLAAVAVCSLAACVVNVQPQAQMCTEPAPTGHAGDSLTYHHDVEPILASRCMRCHTAGGPAPFPLDSYAAVFTQKDAVKGAVSARVMPPWPPARCCHAYANSDALTDDELATVTGWIDQGALEGTPPAQPVVPLRRTLDRVDVQLAMPSAYTPKPKAGYTDDTRCFLLDWPMKETVYVTGLDIKPGYAPQMHHALVLTASADDVKRLQQLDDADEGEGWSCPGGLLGAFKDGLGGSFFEAEQFANGLGHEIDPTDKVVLTMHYAPPASGGFQPDQSAVMLRFQTQPTQKITTLSIFDPAWLAGGMFIPANKVTTVSYADEFSQYNGGKGFVMHSVNLHMHERGKTGQVAVLRKDGSRECLLQIDNWDHAHQGDYQLAEDVKLYPGDRLLLSCTFDNTAGHQKIVNGQLEKPHDLNWAEDQEMCAGFVTASELLPSGG